MTDGYQYLRGTCCLHLEDSDRNMRHHQLSRFRYSVFTCIVLDLPGVTKSYVLAGGFYNSKDIQSLRFHRPQQVNDKCLQH